MSTDITNRLQTGLEHHQAGRLAEAETIYQSIVKERPQHPDAWHFLGILAHQTGNNDAAVNLIENAIKINPGIADFHNNCGEAYRALNNFEKAISLYQQALSINPDFAGAHNNLGNAYKELGQFEDAISSYQRAISSSPDFFMAHNNLGIACKELGRLEESITHYEKALELMPQYAEAHSNLGNVLLELDRPEDAIGHYERAIALTPGYAEAHSNMGNALRKLGQHEDALAQYEKALDIKPDFAMAQYNLGIALDELGRPEQAISAYEQALVIKPDYAEAHNNLGNVHVEFGQSDEAVKHFERALAIKPDFAEAYRHLTMIKPSREQLAVIEKFLADSSISNEEAMHYHFALGNIYHHSEIFDKAGEHYNEGNALKRAGINYSSAYHSAYVDRLIEIYTKDYFLDKTTGGNDSALPVFIIGMPRSGTTLVEQILSSHPQVHGAGELAFFMRVEETICRQIAGSDSYPACMPGCDKAVIEQISEEYLNKLREYSPDATHITDKLPHNFLRVGLIKTLFPGARIIHCQRNAMDTCLSIFINYFVGITGNEYTYDLEEIGNYHIDYEKLMRHWNSIFPSTILNLQYEDLVRNQENISRQLIEFLGLDWDDRCLDFHLTKRAIRTTSSVQVRQSMYTQSIDRWKRYEDHLAPLVAILDRA